ncbi:GNAT family N-acetyltransferase [Roseobacter sinensis]|uniref:GNAT family N-acetyltransferase n=1 Tax=Roseobacter sinensis TaxID=2931391 RepID=A0ABT3BHI4_9RHOB|nr:GNAT family N-acetyltransferase [Roseobacter sp. WL0113]MCV3273017.1 GNAT family N-acetyltransferase [Roseobacter sp. WL0113]
MVSFTYRTLTPDDAAAWQALRLEGVRDFPLGFLTTVEEAVASPERCREILRHGGLRGVLADETLVGFCGYRPQQLERTRHRCEIGPFFVTRRYQGAGAATALMRGVIDEAEGRGIAQIELFVDTENLRAIAFYERQGFQRIATFRDSVRIDGKARQDHFMTLRL